MYDEEILHALKARQYNAIRANERTLLSEMQFTIERNSVRVDGNKSYSAEFLDALEGHGVTVMAPKSSDDRWIFGLPDVEDNYDNY
ncbi:tagatose-bisphosphate aldolase [Lactiplantibacillus pentosus]|uniref:tagatose-bisphosphate aldolase n=1 Tax=Lactiplantibacillus pentosus TaxID=1589 RepID=UPI00133069E7|nr:tagatose-bisphosphate aldolase [Lactiplantibacillus pentosus]MBQ0837550.1 tagatose-bisphosphate aldolase [Lactiplantibacillus pentosus]